MRLTEEFVLGTAAGGQHCFNVFIIGQDLDRSFDTVQHNTEYRIPRYNSSSERHPRSPMVRQYGPPACHRSLYFLRQRVVASHLPPPVYTTIHFLPPGSPNTTPVLCWLLEIKMPILSYFYICTSLLTREVW